MSNRRTLGNFTESKNIEWKVPSLLTLAFSDTDVYESPSFTFADTCWNLRIYPATSPEWLLLYLHNESGGFYDATCSLTITESNGTLFGEGTLVGITAGSVFVCDIDRSRHVQLSSPAENMVIAISLKSGEERKPTIPGKFSIICVLCCSKEKQRSSEKPVVSKQNFRTMRRMDLHTLSKDFENLLDNKESCDTTLYVKDKVFKAHRAVLTARSPVFATMFELDTSEKQTGVINISDCDSDSFEQFLEYLYTGNVKEIPFPSVFHLYCTSDKYDVQTLKTFCADYLMQCLTVENFCDIISFADWNGEAKLLPAVQYFFDNHREYLSITEFRDLLDKISSLTI